MRAFSDRTEHFLGLKPDAISFRQRTAFLAGSVYTITKSNVGKLLRNHTELLTHFMRHE